MSERVKELEKLRRQLQRKRHMKTEFCVRLSVLRLLHVGHVVQIGEVNFPLLGKKGYHEEAKNGRFTAVDLRCRQNFKYKFFSSFGRLSPKNAPKSVPHVQHDYFSSFNQSNN